MTHGQTVRVHRDRRIRPAPLGAGLGVAVALSGCTGGPDPSPAPAPSIAVPSTAAPSASAPSASPSAPSDAPEPVVVRAGSGPVAIDVLVRGVPIDDPHVTVTRGDDTTLTFDLSNLPTQVPAVVALSSPGAFALNADGSVTIVDDHGDAVGGLTRPTPGALFSAADETHLELIRPDEPVDVAEVSTRLGTTAIAGADWGEREGGRSLAVEPTAWTRDAGQAGRAAAWAALTQDEPDADSPGMHDQLVCHAIGARDKATWNLEPWRPDVGLVAVMAARCNPVE